jgi:hypothetical protein
MYPTLALHLLVRFVKLLFRSLILIASANWQKPLRLLVVMQLPL